MVQVIEQQGDIFGRIGAGLGKGLADQLPKEIERKRLSSGLKDFERDSANLSPLQQITRLASIPGAVDRPQLIQAVGELARQQAKGQALSQFGPKEFPQFNRNNGREPPRSQVPSITQPDPLEKFQEGYIPPTQEEIYSHAGEMYNNNPALFGNDPNKAIEAAENAAKKDQDIANAYQTKHQNLTTIQDNVVKRLKQHSVDLGASKLVPANVYSKIEDEAINATKTKKDGGRGLTEQQAMKEYGKELDTIARDYKSIDSLGNWGITAKPAKRTLSNMKSLQQKFEERGDTENFGDQLTAVNKLSPMVAFSIAEPVSREPQLNNFLSKIPTIQKTKSESPTFETQQIVSELAKKLGQKGSPLAVAYELKKKGYDPQVWLDYLIANRKNLGLMESQGRQLDKPNSLTGTLNDWWLSSWTGLQP